MRVPSFLNRVPKRLQFCNFPSYKIKISIFYPFFNRTLERPLFYRFPIFFIKKNYFLLLLNRTVERLCFFFHFPFFPKQARIENALFLFSQDALSFILHIFFIPSISFIFLRHFSTFFAPYLPPFPFPFLALKYPLKSLETPLPLSSIPSAPKIPGNPILHKIG